MMTSGSRQGSFFFFRRVGGVLSLLFALVLIVSGTARACDSSCGSGGCAGGFGCGCGCGAIGDGLNDQLGGTNLGQFNSQNMTLKSHLTMQDMSLNNTGVVGSGLWGWVDPDTRREYALYGKGDGTAFVDVTDPFNPVYLGDMPTQTGYSIWRELQTYGNYLYVVSDSNGEHGVQIFDLRNLRGVTTPQSFSPNSVYNGGNYTLNGSAVNNKFDNAHTIYINQETGIAYLNGAGGVFGGGYHALSLADPLNPTLIGGRSLGYIHDGMTVVYHGPDAEHQGQQISMNSMAGAGLSILNVTEAANPLELSRKGYARLGYTHQGWFTEDHRFFLIDDEFDEWSLGTLQPTSTHIWDVGDLDNPIYLGAFVHDTIAVDHNMFIRDNLVYMSNYSSGLRVYDLNNLMAVANGNRPVSEALGFVGYFDTYYQDDANPEISFNGAWGNYPFLPSGNILIADRQNGLFVVSLNNIGGNAASPEPVTLSLCLLGAGLWWRGRRSRKSN